jgi:hypothetical protein
VREDHHGVNIPTKLAIPGGYVWIAQALACPFQAALKFIGETVRAVSEEIVTSGA